MPRASWRGFLRLSLVSCPIYLSPATTRTKSIRLRQVWQPASVDVDEDDLPARGEEQQGSAPSAPRLLTDDARPDGDQSAAAARVTLRPHDPETGEEIDKREVVKGSEYARGAFVTFTAEELKALDVESSKIIDLEKFVPGGGIDRVYFDNPYYVYTDGPIAVEALRVIGAAMAEAGVVGESPGGDRRGVDRISRPRCLSRRRRFGAPGLPGGRRIALRVVSPDIGFPKHTGAAAEIFSAPMIGIEAVNNRCLTPRFALAHHHAGAAWPFVFRRRLAQCRNGLGGRWRGL